MNISLTSRNFSTTAAALQGLVKTPIQVFGTEGRYASALFSAASKQKQLEKVETDLTAFKTQLKRDKKLSQFLVDPSIKKGVKIEGLAAACKKMGSNPLVANTLQVLAENGRCKEIVTVINTYQTIMAANRGEVQCAVVTAKALDGPMKKEVDSSIQALVSKGQKPLITYSVDPKIMGGMVVSVGDKYVDMSIATKLKRYESIVKSVG